MAESTQAISSVSAASEHGFVRAIGLFDGTMIVVGSMIGSGIFIVAADISRQTGSPGGLLLTWILTGLLTISAAHTSELQSRENLVCRLLLEKKKMTIRQ